MYVCKCEDKKRDLNSLRHVLDVKYEKKKMCCYCKRVFLIFLLWFKGERAHFSETNMNSLIGLVMKLYVLTRNLFFLSQNVLNNIKTIISLNFVFCCIYF